MKKKRRKSTNQDMRKGSSKLLKTLIMRLSLVTESICGPGNCPFINIPCILFENSLITHCSFPQQQKYPEEKNCTKTNCVCLFVCERERIDKITCCFTPRG